MFSSGQLIFGVVFFIVFVVVIIFSYRKDIAIHKIYYKGNYKVLIAFIVFILILFALSYLLYFLREGFILSMIYPFVISYYNVVILQTISKKDFRTITFYMILIGLIASGAGLFVAITNLILFVPIVLLAIILKIMISEYKPNNKEIKYV